MQTLLIAVLIPLIAIICLLKSINDTLKKIEKNLREPGN